MYLNFDLPNNSWLDCLNSNQNRQILQKIDNYLTELTLSKTIIFPKREHIFHALALCPLEATSIVIIAQDPYHGVGEANGLCFSVPKEIKTPPSLRNIFKELKRTFPNFDEHRSSELDDWASQGVLLLNSTLTVAKDSPNSHKNIGWQKITDSLISYLSEHSNGVVFILLGHFAQSKSPLIDTSKHYILATSHPSPLSVYRGFAGSDIFLKCREIILNNNKNPIKWG